MAAAVRRTLPLTERLRPTSLSGLVGNPQARSDLRAWADRWMRGVPHGHRAVLLVGPPGVGKTSAAIALAQELGWGFVEMNASDARNQAAIDQVAGRASISRGLDSVGPGGHGGRTLLLLDEADCLSGRVAEGSRTVVEPPSLREFLQRRYTAIDSLNQAWGLGTAEKTKPFSDWSSVPRSPGRYGWANLAAARRDLEEWKGASTPADHSDRGGLGAIARLVRTTRQPVVLTVNDDRPLLRYSPVFRTYVSRIRFYPIRDAELASRLASVASSEGIRLGAGILETIVGRSRGDLRAALNDLEAIAPLEPGVGQREALGVRDLSSDFAGFAGEALSRPRYYRSVEVQDRLDSPPDDLLPWIEENIDRFSDDPPHREAGFDVLAVAELFLARARRARVYGLWSYASELLAGGVGLAIRERPGDRPAVAGFPQFLAEMGRSKGYRALRAGLALKLGHRFHLSRAKATLTLLPFLETLLVQLVHARGSRPRALAQRLARELELTPEELTFLLGDAADADLVEALLGEGPASPPDETPSERTTRPSSAGSRRPVQRSLSEFGRG